MNIDQEILKDKKLRRELAKRSHYYFFHIYFGSYIKYETALFQKEIFSLTEDTTNKLAVIVAFRGSAKSTIITLSYAIWSILGIQQKKFVIILGQTQQQTRQNLINIKQEFETNELLRNDFGSLEELSDIWKSSSLGLPQYGARIMALSSGESIRGLKHREHRPDLIIADDVEDLASVKTREGRDKTYNWLTGEVIPAGDTDTKIMIVGNLLHEDSLIMRLKKGIETKSLNGIFRSYPLVDQYEQPLWPDKFKTAEDIVSLKQSVGSESAWQREFMLRIISDEDRLVHPEWIQYYNVIPDAEQNRFRFTATGIDLAISEKDSADYTAMVSAKVYGSNEKLKVYILPNPINKRMSFPQTFEQAKALSISLGQGEYTKLFIEEVGYQASLVQHLSNNNIPAEGVKIQGQDKRARLTLITHLIQQGKVVFPEQGVERLIEQLTGFGVEKHDDLADAFSLLLIKILELDKPEPGIYIIDASPFYNYRRDGWKPLSFDTEW